MQQEADYNQDEKQVYLLRQQIICYKQVQRNHHIENDKSKFLYSKDQWEVEKEKIFQNSIRYFHDKIDKNEELKSIFRDRYPKLKLDLNQDDTTLFSEKMQGYVEKRRQTIEQELKKTHQNDPKYLTLKIELLFINSKDFYLKMKEAIINPLLQEENQAVMQSRMLERLLLDRNYFKRDKPQRRPENKLSDKFELSMVKHEQARRKRIKQKEFMQAIFAHQIEFMEFHRKKYKHARKRSVQFKVVLEQKDQKQQHIDKQMRLKDIKQGDMVTYIQKLEKLDEAKKERVVSILRQTDQFLKDIGAKVKIQKGEEITEEDEVVDNNNSKNNLGYELNQANKVYYNITHRIKETVTKQPVLLEGGQLKQYQVQGLDWLVSLYNNSLNGILADEMGLGKTIQTISLLCYLIETKKNFGPFFIIVPLSTLSNWANEFEKWAPTIKKVIYKGSPQVRKEISKQMRTTIWNICLTTYEYVLKDRLALSKYEWKYIIVDEGHRMKNSRSKFAMILGQQYQSDRRLLLTGTPLQNNIAELWALLNFLLPKVFSSCEDFEKWFQMPLSKMGANEKDCQLDEEEQLLIINRLHQVLRPFLLRRVKRDVEKELPRKTEYVIKIKLSAWQKKIYDQINQRGVMTFDQQSGKSGSQALQNLMMQLRKICNHPYLFMLNLDMNRITDEIWRSSGKFELLDRIIPKLLYFKHRLLIFSQMTQLMDIMESFFEYRGWRYLRLDGSTKSEDREARIKLFNQENSFYNIFLLSTRAGGLGLNLQSADTVILFDSDWNPMMDLQAQDRAYRIGQKNEVRVLRLITATQIEGNILSKAEHKMGLDAIIIQAGLYNQRSTDQERRERLQDFFRQKNKVDLFEAEDIPDDTQINEWIARSEEEFEMFNELDRQRYEEEKLIYKNFNQNRDDQQFNYRLIQDDEVPEWITQKQNDVKEIKEYGRGQRERKKNVVYFDSESDLFQDGKDKDVNILDLKIDDQIDIEQRQNDVFQEDEDVPFEEKKNKKLRFIDSDQNHENQEIDNELEPKIISKRKLN
ncbi:unnamed protein product [Paramecium primaurelia]|uniref:Uncharacterized protein n=1 Tax=Paramecium primaurelia TaxID=5886 RepID=A0A8S1KQZ2_PARPR|nr:unnamed protein product [Paramecium primaurelia]